MDPVLASLLLDLGGLSDTEAEQLAYGEYVKLYMDFKKRNGMAGEHNTHDGEPVIFYADRFCHAFFTTSDRISKPSSKDKFDRERASKVRWIYEVIRGRIAKTECWCIQDPNTGVVKRLYVLWDEEYLVWLNPRKQGGWKFTSAYTADRRYIRDKTKKGRCIWTKK